jgi:hypothetical protein
VKRQALAAVVALLAVSAGCSGNVQPPDKEYTEDEIVSLVTDMNASDAQRIQRTHRNTLANASSYYGRYVSEEGGADRYQRSLVVDRADREYVEHWEDGDARYGDIFVDESGHYRRYVTPGNDTYQYTVREASHETFGEKSVFASKVPLPDDTVLERYDFEYVGSKEGAFVFEADSLVPHSEVSYSQFYWDMEDVTNASARLVVDQRGYVRSFTSAVTFERGGSESTREVTVSVTRFGEATTERPGWVDNATAATRAD